MVPILTQSLWRDEAFSALLSEHSLLDIIKLTSRDVSPPLYYFLLHFWSQIFGGSEIALRSLSLLFHIASVIVIFFLAQKLIRSKIAQFAIALAVLLNPFLLQYAFEARTYSLLALLAVLTVYFLTIKKPLFASITLMLSIFAHNFGVFTFAAVLFWWLFTKKEKIFTQKTASLAAVPIIAILIWGFVLWNQWLKVEQGFWIEKTPAAIFITSFEKYTKGDLTFDTQPMLYTFSFILALFAFSYWVVKEKKEETGIPMLMVWIAVIPTLITYFISALFVPIYHERYLIATAPMLILLAGYSLAKLFELKPHLRYTLTAVSAIYLILLVQSADELLQTSTKPALNYGVKQILSKAEPGDILVPKDVLNFLEAKYYVSQSEKKIPVYALSRTGKIPFYIGGILYEQDEIIREIPKDKRVWILESNGGHLLLEN